MDKNGNGSPAQFSPEELIRRLKSQLNINSEDKTENEAPVKDPVDAETVHPEDIAVSEDVAAEGTDGVEIESVNVDPDVNDDVAVDDVADVEVNEVSAEEAESDVVDESEEEADGSVTKETVEFSISDLFDKADKNSDSVSAVDVNEEGEIVDTKIEAKSDDDVDFFSFLAGSGISAEAAIDEPEDDLAEALAIDVDEADEEPDSKTDTFEAETVDDSELNVADIDVDSDDDAGDTVLDAAFVDDTAEGVVTVEEAETPASDSVADDELDASESYDVAENAADTEESVPYNGSDLPAVSEEKTSEEDDYEFDGEGVNSQEDPDAKPLPDFNMLIALGIPVAEVVKIYGQDAADEYARMTGEADLMPDTAEDEDEYEYSSRSQNDEISDHYKNEKILSIVKLCAAAVLFIFALFFENLTALGAKYNGWMEQAAFPVVHIMVDLQLVLIAGVLAYDELVSGVKALLRRSANAGTLLAAAVIINVIYDVVLCFTDAAKLDAKLSGASVIFAIMLCLLSSALKLWAEIKAFDMISAKGVKCCVLTDSPDDMRERAAFFEKVSDDEASKSGVLSFGRTKFVGGFFRNQTSEHATVVDKILAPAAIVGAVIAFIVAYATSKDIGVALCTLNCSAAFLVPVSVFAAGTLTYAKACSYADSMKSAIIGENTPYDYADSSVVAFDDKDAYPSYCVKLRNLKVYGSIAIVDVLRITATLFRKIGGPLNDVLENATSEINKDAPIEITRSSEAGIEAVYNGKRILLGKADFLHSYGIIPYTDVDDREYLKTGDVSIMYVAVDNELSAKFYIQYTLDVDFEVLLRDLNRAGICVSIRTSDPNIDRRLLQAKLNLNKTALRIVYCEPGMGRGEVQTETVSGVIGTGTPSELVHTAMLCDRVVHVYRTNNIIKALSLAVGIALLILFALISVNLNVFSGLLIIYQLFWMIPTLVVSKLFL